MAKRATLVIAFIATVGEPSSLASYKDTEAHRCHWGLFVITQVLARKSEL